MLPKSLIIELGTSLAKEIGFMEGEFNVTVHEPSGTGFLNFGREHCHGVCSSQMDAITATLGRRFHGIYASENGEISIRFGTRLQEW